MNTENTNSAVAALQAAQTAEAAARQRLEEAKAELAELDTQLAEADPDASGFADLVARRTQAAAAVSAHEARVDRAAAALPPLAAEAHAEGLRKLEAEAAAFGERLRAVHREKLDRLVEFMMAEVRPARAELEALMIEGAHLQARCRQVLGEPHPALAAAILGANSWATGTVAAGLHRLAEGIEAARAEARRG